jgi:ligand-binding SRPBCC domain-containing protein
MPPHSCTRLDLPEDFRISIATHERDHVLRTIQTLPIQRERAFVFFQNPQNLFDITPDWLDFRMDACQQGEKVFEGAEYDYHIRWFGLKVRWRSKIQNYNPPGSFTDIQIAGPYTKWEHTHTFEEQGEKTLMLDSVTYRLPFLYLGRLTHALIVQKQLKDIFCYRALKIREWVKGELNENPILGQYE